VCIYIVCYTLLPRHQVRARRALFHRRRPSFREYQGGFRGSPHAHRHPHQLLKGRRKLTAQIPSGYEFRTRRPGRLLRHLQVYISLYIYTYIYRSIYIYTGHPHQLPKGRRKLTAKIPRGYESELEDLAACCAICRYTYVYIYTHLYIYICIYSPPTSTCYGPTQTYSEDSARLRVPSSKTWPTAAPFAGIFLPLYTSISIHPYIQATHINFLRADANLQRSSRAATGTEL